MFYSRTGLLGNILTLAKRKRPQGIVLVGIQASMHNGLTECTGHVDCQPYIGDRL